MSPPAHIKLWVAEDGTVTFVYDDDVAAALDELGLMYTERAGHVEPTADNRWTVRLVGGPSVGPFDTRREALAVEAEMVNDGLSLGVARE